MMQRQSLSQSENRQRRRTTRRAARRGAFTLIEIMVALSIFLIMMVIIFVPLNMGLNLFSIGKTRSDVLQAAHSTLDDMEGELRKAITVFPNAALPGVTNQAPYNSSGVNPQGHPYLRVTASGYGVCDANTAANAEYVDNPHRLDFLLPDTFNNGEEQVQAVMPLRAAPYLVSYYYRRQSLGQDLNSDGDLDDPGESTGADPFDNPITLFRAQMPYRENSGPILYSAGGGRNVNLLPVAQGADASRYPNPSDTTACGSGAAATATNRGSYWLNQLATPAQPLNEPNLGLLAVNSNVAPTANGSHTSMLPKGIALVARNAFNMTAPDYTPDTTFQCADTNGDGKIDQVTITLVIGSYDENGADRSNTRSRDNNSSGNYSVNDQRIRQTRVVTLSNVR